MSHLPYCDDSNIILLWTTIIYFVPFKVFIIFWNTRSVMDYIITANAHVWDTDAYSGEEEEWEEKFSRYWSKRFLL